MKRYFLFTLLVIGLFAACKKDKNIAVNSVAKGSIYIGQALFRSPTYGVQDSTTITQLMASNNLSTAGFTFYTYQQYNALDQNNQMGLYQIGEAHQIRNGLPVFMEDISFPFLNGKFNEPYPAAQFIAINIPPDNQPQLNIQALRDTFVKVDNASEAHNIGIQDSVLVAQLGYYDPNITQRYNGVAPAYIKVWYVHPQHSYYPYGYFRNDTGATIYLLPETHPGGVIFP